MNGLFENARMILNTAAEADQIGGDACDWTIFIGPNGGLEMIAGTETPLDALAWNRSASMAWQVKHINGGVRVDGLATRESCRLELGSAQSATQSHVQDAGRTTPSQFLGSTSLFQLVQAA